MLRRLASIVLLFVAASCASPDFGFISAKAAVLESCRDGKLSPGESDVDCGPICGSACASGLSCTADEDCASAFCSVGVCRDQTCSDQLKNRDESDVDCGGDTGCARCTPGAVCAKTSDCDGGACVAGQCRAPSCSDALENQGESDVDCGGRCAPCADGKTCRSNEDCGPALCTGNKCRPQTCSDGILNQSETDVDCGGTGGCQRCTTAQHCVIDGDCDHAHCSQGACQPTSCADGVLNGSETDIDCGGTCPACAAPAACLVAGDCASRVCSSGTLRCAAPTCSDGVLNGSEPTIDCGASCSSNKKCKVADVCAMAADCASGDCFHGHCVPKSATNSALSTTGWQASSNYTQSDDTLPRFAIDGDPNTYWTSGKVQYPGMWFVVDMLKPQVFYSVKLTSTSMPSDYGKTLKLSVSDDGITYTELRTDIAGEETLVITFVDPNYGRYLKLDALEDTGYFWWRIDELDVLQ